MENKYIKCRDSRHPIYKCIVGCKLMQWEKTMPFKPTTTIQTVKVISVLPKQKRNNEGLSTVATFVYKGRLLETKTICITELDSDEECIEDNSANQLGNE